MPTSGNEYYIGVIFVLFQGWAITFIFSPRVLDFFNSLKPYVFHLNMVKRLGSIKYKDVECKWVVQLSLSPFFHKRARVEIRHESQS